VIDQQRLGRHPDHQLHCLAQRTGRAAHHQPPITAHHFHGQRAQHLVVLDDQDPDTATTPRRTGGQVPHRLSGLRHGATTVAPDGTTRRTR
jgi:hypothetical protein